MPLTETITWHAVTEQLPDADLTVLVTTRNCEEPVWLGFLDGETWRDTSGSEIEVTHWADMPHGGAAATKCLYCTRDMPAGSECQSEEQADKCDMLAFGVNGLDGAQQK